MISLCYVSSSSKRFDNDELVNLLNTCRENNSQKNITGLLLYNGQGTFIQALEGEESTIIPLYEKIKTDSRHSRVNCLSKHTIEERNFPNWKMGFRHLDKESVGSIQGFSTFLQQKDSNRYLSEKPHLAESLLAHFKNKSNELIF